MKEDALYQAFLVVVNAFEDVLLALSTEKRRKHGWERGDVAIIRELIEETKRNHGREKSDSDQQRSSDSGAGGEV